jgi:antibiotic biosynthesis monooxygenase (ABM) superfamily enzyme
VVTLAAWLVAFGVVTALLALFGHQLASMPLALRALVMSGVLVALMLNLVMPLLDAAVARWLRGAPPTREPRGWLPPRSGDDRPA